MALEDTLTGWTAPSSDAEQEKQDRTERMIRDAIGAHPAFNSCRLRVYAKGSYANNTNVRADSDVDVAVECTEVEYWEEATPGMRAVAQPYEGSWTPAKLRRELNAALNAKFPGRLVASGSTAITVKSSTARVDADVVPCFSYRYYVSNQESRVGTKIFTTTERGIVNYPAQQLENGRAKNSRTAGAFKKGARILKRVENALVAGKLYRELPSYFVECLAYNCPDTVFGAATWTEVVRLMLIHLWQGLDVDEPRDTSRRWLEVNECFYLFHPGQSWARAHGRDFAKASWNFLGYRQ